MRESDQKQARASCIVFKRRRLSQGNGKAGREKSTEEGGIAQRNGRADQGAVRERGSACKLKSDLHKTNEKAFARRSRVREEPAVKVAKGDCTGRHATTLMRDPEREEEGRKGIKSLASHRSEPTSMIRLMRPTHGGGKHLRSRGEAKKKNRYNDTRERCEEKTESHRTFFRKLGG